MRGVVSLALRVAIVAFFVIATVFSGEQSFARDKRIKVVATTGMIADTVRAIAGEQAEVVALMGPGVDPHLYRQTRSDVITLARADIVFYNGHFLEAQLEDLLLKLKKTKPVVAVAERVPRERLLAHEDYKDKFDPHVWMDPDLWAYAAEAVRDELIARDPGGRPVYEANAAVFLADLRRLSDYAKTVLASVPEKKRVLISAHDAFRYFGRAYGFEVLGIQGISTESEAGLKRIETLVGLIVERRIDAIFVEASVSDRNVKALIEGAAAKGHAVRIGGQLFSDSMGNAGTYEGTFIGMIDHNATVIARALGGDAPNKGLNGRLGVGT